MVWVNNVWTWALYEWLQIVLPLGPWFWDKDQPEASWMISVCFSGLAKLQLNINAPLNQMPVQLCHIAMPHTGSSFLTCISWFSSSKSKRHAWKFSFWEQPSYRTNVKLTSCPSKLNWVSLRRSSKLITLWHLRSSLLPTVPTMAYLYSWAQWDSVLIGFSTCYSNTFRNNNNTHKYCRLH